MPLDAVKCRAPAALRHRPMTPHAQALAFVVFVGGPLHGKGALMANPERLMLLGEPGEEVRYCKRCVENSQTPNCPDVAFYAPEEMSEGEFDSLIADDSKYRLPTGGLSPASGR